MNPIKKIYCRCFQLAFHLALPLLPYREPKIPESTQEVLPLLKTLDIQSVLLVTDKTMKETGATARLEESLREGGIHCAVFSETCPNPTTHNVEAARERAAWEATTEKTA